MSFGEDSYNQNITFSFLFRTAHPFAAKLSLMVYQHKPECLVKDWTALDKIKSGFLNNKMDVICVFLAHRNAFFSTITRLIKSEYLIVKSFLTCKENIQI